jgi:hypothetical protein
LKSIKTYLAVAFLALIISQSMMSFYLQCKVVGQHGQNWHSKGGSLNIFYLTDEELKAALVNSHEARIQGHLYDIRSLEKTAGSNRLTVCADEEEDGILKHIAALFSSGSSDAKTPDASLSLFYAFDFFESHNLNMPPFIQSANELRFINTALIPSASIPVSSPPPEA